MQEFIRDTRRDEDRENMQQLIMELRQERREENTGRRGNAVRVNNRNTRIIKKKDIKHHNNRKGIGNSYSQSKRKIIRSQGIINKR